MVCVKELVEATHSFSATRAGETRNRHTPQYNTIREVWRLQNGYDYQNRTILWLVAGTKCVA